MKSLQNLSNVHIYQYTQMVNAPAGGQAGAARCCHRAKCLFLKVGLCIGLLIVCHFVATDQATRWVFTLVCNNKTAANRPALSARSEASLPGCVFIQFGRSMVVSRRSCRAIMSDPVKKLRRRCTVTFGATTNNFRSQRCVAGRPCKR